MSAGVFLGCLLSLARRHRRSPEMAREELERELQRLDSEDIALLTDFLPNFEATLDAESDRRDV